MIRIEITPKNTYEYKFLEADNIPQMCRKILQYDKTEQGLEAYREDKKCLIVNSIQEAALLSIREEPSLCYIKFKPFVAFKK